MARSKNFSRRKFVKNLSLAAGAASLAPFAMGLVENESNRKPKAAPRKKYIVTLRWAVDAAKVAGGLDPERHPLKVAHEHGCKPSHVFHHAIKGFVDDLEATQVEKLLRDPRVLYVEEDGPVKMAAAIPVQTVDPQQIPTGVLRMAANLFPVAHINGVDQRINVDVAVLDTGMDLTHPELNIVQNASFVEPELADGHDWSGHGTHVAGILGAIDNGTGVVGVAPVRLWNVQVLGQTQSEWVNVINGMNYIAQHANEIAVVNASLGGGVGNSPCGSLRQAALSLVNSGIVFVVGAGNDAREIAGPDGIFGTNFSTFTCDDAMPAALREVMAVSSMNPTNDQLAATSNFNQTPRTGNFVNSPGGAIDVAAPGVSILSTYVDTNTLAHIYAYDSGTSMSSPHVAGLVALYIAANGRATNAAGVYAIRQAIVDASLPQGQWNNPNTLDPDSRHEPLAMPSEVWVPKPKVTGQTMTSEGFAVLFPTTPGYRYILEHKDALETNAAPWNALPAIDGTGQTVLVTNTVPLAPTQFYRVRRTPSP